MLVEPNAFANLPRQHLGDCPKRPSETVFRKILEYKINCDRTVTAGRNEIVMSAYENRMQITWIADTRGTEKRKSARLAGTFSL